MATRRRYTTFAEDVEFLGQREDDLKRDWKPGDACRPYKGRVTTIIVRFEGDIVFLANGESMHRSHLRRPFDDAGR